MIATEEDWPHGLRCMDCDELLLGHGYSKRLMDVKPDGTFVTEIVCVPCGTPKSAWFGEAERELEEY